MSHSYPGSELSVEQLVHALARVLNPDSPLRRQFLSLEPQKIYDIEHENSQVSQGIRTIRNTFVPVNRLPPEILSRVLECRTCELDLVVATQICQHWRSTLISSPSLWTCFRFRSNHDVDRTLTYLERSKSAPIDVSMRSGWQPNFEALEYLAPQIARIRSLAIQGDHITSPFFCNPAPLLQHLEIRSHSGNIVRLPDNFLGQHAPSLRSVNFGHACPTLEIIFPLPNLTEFHLYLTHYMTPFRVGALFQFLSGSPLLQKVVVEVESRSIEDVSLDKVISLESLVELDCSCDCAGQILPFLRLPRLKRLQVTSKEPRRTILWEEKLARTLADVLPSGGRPLLAEVTKMFYYSLPDAHCHTVKLSGNGVDVSFCAFGIMGHTTIIDWSPDRTYIPFGQIEDLELAGGYSTPAAFPVNVFALESLKVLRLVPWDEEFARGLLRSLHPDQGATEVPCRFLQEIKYTYWESQGSFPRLLVSLVRERERAGYQLGLVSLVIRDDDDVSHQDFLEELKEHVGEVRVRTQGERE